MVVCVLRSFGVVLGEAAMKQAVSVPLSFILCLHDGKLCSVCLVEIPAVLLCGVKLERCSIASAMCS